MIRRPAAELANLRSRAQKVCPHCGAEFLALKTQTYCSQNHRKAAWQKRDTQA